MIFELIVWFLLASLVWGIKTFDGIVKMVVEENAVSKCQIIMLPNIKIDFLILCTQHCDVKGGGGGYCGTFKYK